MPMPRQSTHLQLNDSSDRVLRLETQPDSEDRLRILISSDPTAPHYGYEITLDVDQANRLYQFLKRAVYEGEFM